METNRYSFKDQAFDLIWKIAQHCVPTKPYLQMRFFVIFKRFIDWRNPKSFSEKIQWLKVYGFKPEYVTLVDKVLVKEYVRNIIGDEYIIPTLGVWDSPSEIDFSLLPDKFVLKCNHSSGEIVICTDKTKLDFDEARIAMKKCLRENYYLNGREKPYKYVKRKVFAEQFMQDKKTNDIRDYKFFCFDGVPKALFVATDRKTDCRFDFFDMNFDHLPIKNGHENASFSIEKPQNFELMKEIASKLSQGMPHARIDLYEINGKVYFGEITLYHFNGFMPFVPDEWDYTFGSWLTLPSK